ncbi:MAG TPA: hypothetical protein VNX47_06080, partial [Nevskia sp.]|nr:hypothetical protein [Nevskia sp.]
LAAMIGSLLALMFVLNRPFQGPLGIEPEPFEASLALFKLIDSDFKQIESEEKAGEPSPAPAAAAAAAVPAEEPHTH